MKRMPENKPRKATRIILCVLYLVEIILCFTPSYSIMINGKNVSYSHFEMVCSIFNRGSYGEAIVSFFMFLFPIVALVFCVVDKESNIKNIVSLICCVFSGGLIVFNKYIVAIGSIFAFLIYIQIIQVTILSMLSRLIKGNNQSKEKNAS